MTTVRFRLSERSPRDRQLAEWVADDGDNVSEIMRDLLYSYYVRKHNGESLLFVPSLSAGAVQEDDSRESPDDELVQGLAGLDFSFGMD